MGVRRQGFALMVVLIAVATVFALALRGAMVARSTTLEVGALHGRVVAERWARGAVAIALKGIVPVEEGEDVRGAGGEGVEVVGGAGGAAVVGGGGGEDEKKSVELPEFLKELIPELAELENQAKEDLTHGAAEMARVADGRGMTGRVPRRAGISERLNEVGLPVGWVRVEVEGHAFRVRMWDATGLLNVNRADETQLVRYLKAKGVGAGRAVEIAEQLLDWRDADRLKRDHGAEQDVYDRMGIGCRNGEVYSLEELLFLPSMDRALFESIEDDLSVGGDGLIHVGSAPREVLASLPGMDAEAVEAVMGLRRAGRISEDALRETLPAMRRESLMQKMRVELSGVIRVRVEALAGEGDGGGDRVTARFDGIAVLTGRRVEEIGLRAM